MVDTINALINWKPFPRIIETLDREGLCRWGGWELSAAVKRDKRSNESYVEIAGFHDALKINIRGKNYNIDWIQASLPRVLFNFNGRLIKNPNELNDALELVFQYLSEIATLADDYRLIEFTRVDLVLNIPCDPKTAVAVHKNATHQKVKSDPTQYGDTGIEFTGKNLKFLLYWKQKEQAAKFRFALPPLSKSVRAEVQIKSKTAVRKLLGGQVRYAKGLKRDPEDLYPVSHLDFFQCYNIFRDAWLSFDKNISAPPRKCTLHNLIAECEAEGFRTRFGLSAWEWFSLNKQKRATLNRLRPLVQATKQTVANFHWNELLPAHWNRATVVDIYPDGTEKFLTNLW